jgi:predicted DNA-binding transcriptional regulator AlpA
MTPSTNMVTAQRPSMDALIDMKFITADCMLSDKWIYRLISQDRFPRPIKIGRMSRWRAADYYGWRDQHETGSIEKFEDMRRQAKELQRASN